MRYKFYKLSPAQNGNREKAKTSDRVHGICHGNVIKTAERDTIGEYFRLRYGSFAKTAYELSKGKILIPGHELCTYIAEIFRTCRTIDERHIRTIHCMYTGQAEQLVKDKAFITELLNRI